MTFDRFEEILRQLSAATNIPSLHPDKHRLCRLNVNGVLHIQLECQNTKIDSSWPHLSAIFFQANSEKSC